MLRVKGKPKAVQHGGVWFIHSADSFTRHGWTLPEAYASWCHRNHQRYTLT